MRPPRFTPRSTRSTRSTLFSRAFWTGLLLSASVLVGMPAQVGAQAVTQRFTPVNGVFTITGHGWGHGHGMSQYGARGAARAGLNAGQILAFYYPGTALAPYDSNIRVRLMADSGGVQIVAGAGQVVRAADGSGSVALMSDPSIDRWRLAPSGGGNVLQLHWTGSAAGAWVPTGTSFAGDAEFVSSTGALQVAIGSGFKTYRGAMRATAASPGSSTRYTVNVLPIDDYVRGVVGSEMPTSWETAAVQAQAVAARSYGAFEAADNASQPYDICDTASCQVYGGVAAESAAGNAAVDATAKIIVAYNGRPAFTQFSSSNGGFSSAGSQPYLVGQADPYDAAGGNPYSTWSLTVAASTIASKYPELGTLNAIVVTDREGGGDWGGYVNTVVLDGSNKDVTITGETLRSKLGLRSRYYTFGDVAVQPSAGALPTAAGVSAPEVARPIPTTTKAITASLKSSAKSKGLGATKGKLVTKGSWSSLRFAKGIAYFNRKNGGIFLLKDKLATKYIAMGGTSSKLGAPTSSYTYKDKAFRATFAKGVLKWNGKTKRFFTSYKK